MHQQAKTRVAVGFRDANSLRLSVQKVVGCSRVLTVEIRQITHVVGGNLSFLNGSKCSESFSDGPSLWVGVHPSKACGVS